MFQVLNFEITPPDQAVIEIELDNDLELLSCQLDNFDREGFEFLPIEKLYYERNGRVLYHKKVFAKESGILDGWDSLVYKWFEYNQPPVEVFIDHSYCLQAFKFVGRAFDQIKKMSKYRPELLKLLQSKIKYGTDFCVDVLIGDKLIEALHFEWDFTENEYPKFLAHKQFCEDRILEIDWVQFANTINDKYSFFKFDQDLETFKARQFGLDKSNKLVKRF